MIALCSLVSGAIYLDESLATFATIVRLGIFPNLVDFSTAPRISAQM